MRTDTPKTIHLKDYTPYPYTLLQVDLNFDIHEGYTMVRSTLRFHAPQHTRAALFLYGEDLELISITRDGQAVSDYAVDEKGLTLPCPHQAEFTLEIVTRIQPEKNTRLEGLYKSGGNYCTQCEAEGFRRITYFPDRPDVMTVFTVRMEADREKYPVLLSNGNLVEKSEVPLPDLASLDHPSPLREREAEAAPRQGEGKRHYAIWHDPFPKPCYLFALVAGNLNHIHDTFITKSGRKVDLYIYVRPGDEAQCGFAMESLKKSMKWDEDVYGLEYDLDLFNIVAVSDFNMGAMENKSLNIFNTALVLAHSDTATDTDFMRVESVIAHEYFHNWSGNRVTCRDWFQLSLKEGLTVFRDQEFSADLHSRAVQRIDDVMQLRRLQFPEDAGPLAHPIRPESYIEINNFYTTTVYEKGAEVIRMMRTILGAEAYQRGAALYFQRHDGQAATCEDFIKAIEDSSGVDLTQFRLWYSQAGTPDIVFEDSYDVPAKTYRVTLTQNLSATPGQPMKNPMHIPVVLGLLGGNGDEIKIDSPVLQLRDARQDFVFENISSRPIPSILREFSAPVRLKANLSDADLGFLMVHDGDGFNRWESGQILALRVLQRMMDEGRAAPGDYITTYGDLLTRALKDTDASFMARAIALPDITRIAQEQAVVDPQKIYNAREALRVALVEVHRGQLNALYESCREGGAFSLSAESMGKRELKNVVLRLLMDADLAQTQYDQATNMTDRVGALSVLSDLGVAPPFEDFYMRFKNYPLVIDKWFSLQAVAVRDDTIQKVQALRAHPDFNVRNPNRARSLYGAFAMNNPVIFHRADGAGYELLMNAVIELNRINPQIAARLLTPLREWRRYTPDRQTKMKQALERILQTPDLSPDVFEIASKSLQGS